MFKSNKADKLFSFLFAQLNQQERLIITLAVVALYVCGTFVFAAPEAHAQTAIPHLPTYSGYNCKNSHCYAIALWHGSPVTGSSVTINEGVITCGTCDGFIDNEMWLADNNSNLCVFHGYPGCWVEAGYATFTKNNVTNPGGKPSCVTNSAANCYFWADARPNDHENPIPVHVVTNVPTSDYGGNSTFSISQLSSSSWSVQISPASGNGNSYQGTSTANPMVPYDIQIGQELYGANGAGANRTDFYDSEWENSQSFHYQTGPGKVGVQNPLSGRWVSAPNSSNSGGDFCTAC
jgi:hypothetical protein